MSSDNELLAALPQTSRATRTIAFTGGKGGVGTSVIALNTAILLARLGKRVIILDGNFGLGSLNILLGWSPPFNISHVFAGEKRLDKILLAGPEGIRVIPAASGVPELEYFDEEDWQELLGQLESIKAGCDFFLIDTGPGIGPRVLDLIAAADEAIVVTRPEPTAVASAFGLMKAVVRQNVGYPFHLLLNMVHNGYQARQVYDSMLQLTLRFLGYQPGFAGFVPMDSNVSRSVMEEKPFVLGTPNSEASQCLWSLAEKLAGVKANKETAVGRKKKFWRVFLAEIHKKLP